jgi:hypothetical protein
LFVLFCGKAPRALRFFPSHSRTRSLRREYPGKNIFHVKEGVMKKRLSLFSVLVFALALPALVLTGCPTDGGGDGDPSPAAPTTTSGSLGDGDLTLSGTVYKSSMSSTGAVLTPYTTADTVGVQVAGSPPVFIKSVPLDNGVFSVTLGSAEKPTPANPVTVMFTGWSSSAANPPSATAAMIELGLVSKLKYIQKEKQTGSGTGPSNYTMEQGMVEYWYVSDNVTLTLGKGVGGGTSGGITFTQTNNAVTLSLTKGWNAVYVLYRQTVNGTTGTVTVTLSTSIPTDLNWAFSE